MNGHLIPIFSTGVYKVNIGCAGDDIKEYIDTLDYHKMSSDNWGSDDVYVLRNKQLSDLKQKIEEQLNYYGKEIMKIRNDIYITNSWVNKNGNGGQHNSHHHMNSIYSGVYYINVDDDNSFLQFENPVFPMLDIVPQERNQFNSTGWQMPVENGDVIIFPSSVFHSVPANRSDKTRISLAFNSFVKGSIGEHVNTNYVEFI